MPLPVATWIGRDFGATPTCGPAMPTPSSSGDVTVLRRARGAKNGFFGRVVNGQDVHDLGLVGDQ